MRVCRVARDAQLYLSTQVRVLRACRFNTSHGWMGAGPPRSIAAAARSSLRDGAPLLRGGRITLTLTLTLTLTP